jgi:hypothetical protein
MRSRRTASSSTTRTLIVSSEPALDFIFTDLDASTLVMMSRRRLASYDGFVDEAESRN